MMMSLHLIARDNKHFPPFNAGGLAGWRRRCDNTPQMLVHLAAAEGEESWAASSSFRPSM